MIIINKTRFILFLLSVIMLLVIFLTGISYFYIKNQFSEPLSSGNNYNQIFVVKEGEGLKKIAANLEKDNLIKNDIWFMSYILLKGWGAQLKAGEYLINPGLNVKEIANKIIQGETNSVDIKITIPEGFNLKKIDARLAKYGLIEEGELANKEELEGYLFPDTYNFEKGESLEKIISKMKENFADQLDSKIKADIEDQGKDIEEIIIMASIIEKEVNNDQDRKIVSGIFWRRLADNYPLESCATIAYALEIDKWRYSQEDTEIDSAYNTYRNIGLPPTPICNPGLSSIKAAVYPQESDYYFFLSGVNGETVFSKTLEEHNQNKAKYLY